jgi:hypothetical protein
MCTTELRVNAVDSKLQQVEESALRDLFGRLSLRALRFFFFVERFFLFREDRDRCGGCVFGLCNFCGSWERILCLRNWFVG